MHRDEVRGLYRKLVLARRAEEKIREEYFKDEMKTPVHLGIGGEAIPTGVCHCLPPETKHFGTYRNHALFLALSGDTDGFFAELYGKATGVGKGKAGSMHLSSPAHGLVATSAVVGTTIPVAVGAAMANQYRRSADLVAVFFGDGALEEGVFWESVNFACLRRLKVLFVCEDNGLAIHSHVSERQGFRAIEQVLSAFPCHVTTGDGSDLVEVMTATKRVVQAMADNPGPGFLRLTYFRFLEHVGPLEDFQYGYRPRPQPDELQQLDPVHRFEQYILAQGIPATELEAIRQSVETQIEASVASARTAPFPGPQELYQDVFS